jgi:tryptophan 2,3-dioxygenase
MTLTYHDYLRLDALLALQEPRSTPAEHDELLFIVIHQVYELWFLETLHELEKVCRDFTTGDVFAALGTLKRVRMILKTAVGQLDILETMTPTSFMAFRDRLDTASGFQSAQFREVEFLLGHKRTDILQAFPPGTAARERLDRRLASRSLVDHFYDLLERRGVAIPLALRERDPRLPTEANAEVQAGLLRLYRAEPDMALLFEQMTDIDEGLQEWRYRHVKLVERTIGNKRGTGGSLGVEFLRKTLFQPVFPDLWAIRHEL